MPHESTLLPPDWNIPPNLRGRLGTTAGRQRVMQEGGHLLLVLHAPPGADDTARRGRFFWRDEVGTWRVAPKAEHVVSLDQHLNEYARVIENLEQIEDDARQARDYFELLDRLTPLARAVRNMHDALQEARDAVRTDRQLIVARDQAYELLRRAELLHDDAKNSLDFAVAWQAEQMGDHSYQMSVATHRLNILVAFFFPVATLMAIFGTNLKHGLEDWDTTIEPVPLLAVLAAGLFAGILLTGFVTRPARRPKRELQSKSSSSTTRRSK